MAGLRRRYLIAAWGSRSAPCWTGALRKRRSSSRFRFGGRSSVSTWLLAIARYKGLSARRRRTDAELDDELASSLADPADDPELVLQKKNRAEVLRQSLARLSLEHGEVIDVIYYHGKCVKEVAENNRHQRGHGEDAHVFCAQEIGRAGRDRQVGDIAPLTVLLGQLVAHSASHLILQRRAGATSLPQTADALNAGGITMPHGGQ